MHSRANLRWVHSYDTTQESFVNTILPVKAELMLPDLKALTRAVNDILLKDTRKLAKLAKKINTCADDVSEGLVAQ